MNDGKLELSETVGIIADASANTINITLVSEEVAVLREEEPVAEEPVAEEPVMETATEENTEG